MIQLEWTHQETLSKVQEDLTIFYIKTAIACKSHCKNRCNAISSPSIQAY